MTAPARTAFVVDDEVVIASTLAIILTQAGFSAQAFADPVKALEASHSVEPDLLISDVMMPQMTGIELGIEFRKKKPNCKILLFSGQSATADLLAEARAQGHDFELLAKPIHPVDLLAKLRS